MTFSFIIPAYNAAATLGQTLESLILQSCRDWEAVVVDDGSTDNTTTLAARYAARDSRIRVLRQRNAGMGAARNAGIPEARGEWLVFLDADDWMRPEAIAGFQEAAEAEPEAGLICGRWARVARTGEILEETFRPSLTELFPVTVRFCPFAIHSCAVRRELIEQLGGFDSNFTYCADWDLWQRVARLGTRIGATDTLVALYRMGPGSSVTNVESILGEGLRIIMRGHMHDPRVRRPDPRYAAGLPISGLVSVMLHFLCWQAGIELGLGRDARPLLRALRHGDRDPELEPAAVAQAIHAAALLSRGLPPTGWTTLWDEISPSLREFLSALEARSEAAGLARRTENVLERRVLRDASGRPITIGRCHAIRLEVTEPLQDLGVPPGVERLLCALTLGGSHLGELELPAAGVTIPAALLADAIVAHHAWPILGRFFAEHVYPRLERGEHEGRVSIRRGEVTLADSVSVPDPQSPVFHDAVGWTVFLQEFWGLPEWPRGQFYADGSEEEEEESATLVPTEGYLTLELTDPLPVLETEHSVDVEWTLAGTPIHFTSVEPVNGRITPQRLRATVTRETGFELARAAVREALVGTSFSDAAGLRERLARAAARNQVNDGQEPRDIQVVSTPETRLAPSWRRAMVHALAGSRGAALGRRAAGVPGTSVSRRALLPPAARQELLESAQSSGDPVVCGTENDTGHPIPYVPEALCIGPHHVVAESPVDACTSRGRLAAEGYDRHYFETVFLASRDPWEYVSAFERLKYEQILSLVPQLQPRRVLELACAEGLFTSMLAPEVGHLLATDISAVAMERAKVRCDGLTNVRFQLLDFAMDELTGDRDLIICSEALYYLRDRSALGEVAGKIARALTPGGHCIIAHSTVVVDDPESTGLNWDVPFGAKVIGEVFAGTPGLKLEQELWNPYYRIQLFRREVEGEAVDPPPPIVTEVPSAALPPRLTACYLIGGGELRRGGKPAALTYRLPILLYHQVADGRSGPFAKYRVTPEAFEAQISYLREAAFRTVTLDEWAEAMRRYEPLTGRSVLLTFDDGYRDFAETAWPILKRHGFDALVFLVSAHIGGKAAWTSAYGETADLLDWREIRRLREEGVRFGSHTATHPHLEALPPADVVREAARSRAALQGGLGTPVTALAYPHGSEDPAIQHLVGACGYVYGLSCRRGLSAFTDPLLALPRVEIHGDDTLMDFIRKLGN